MNGVIRHLINLTHHFNGWDYALFKLCLLAIGILLGVYCAAFFSAYLAAVWTVAVVSWGYLVWRLIHYHRQTGS